MSDDGCQSSVRPSKVNQQPSSPFSQDLEPEAVLLADGVPLSDQVAAKCDVAAGPA